MSDKLIKPGEELIMGVKKNKEGRMMVFLSEEMTRGDVLISIGEMNHLVNRYLNIKDAQHSEQIIEVPKKDIIH